MSACGMLQGTRPAWTGAPCTPDAGGKVRADGATARKRRRPRPLPGPLAPYRFDWVLFQREEPHTRKRHGRCISSPWSFPASASLPNLPPMPRRCRPLPHPPTPPVTELRHTMDPAPAHPNHTCDGLAWNGISLSVPTTWHPADVEHHFLSLAPARRSHAECAWRPDPTEFSTPRRRAALERQNRRLPGFTATRAAYPPLGAGAGHVYARAPTAGSTFALWPASRPVCWAPSRLLCHDGLLARTVAQHLRRCAFFLRPLSPRPRRPTPHRGQRPVRHKAQSQDSARAHHLLSASPMPTFGPDRLSRAYVTPPIALVDAELAARRRAPAGPSNGWHASPGTRDEAVLWLEEPPRLMPEYPAALVTSRRDAGLNLLSFP